MAVQRTSPADAARAEGTRRRAAAKRAPGSADGDRQQGEKRMEASADHEGEDAVGARCGASTVGPPKGIRTVEGDRETTGATSIAHRDRVSRPAAKPTARLTRIEVSAAAVVCGVRGVSTPGHDPPQGVRPIARPERGSTSGTRPAQRCSGPRLGRGGGPSWASNLPWCIRPAGRSLPAGHGRIIDVRHPSTFHATSSAGAERRIVRDPTARTTLAEDVLVEPASVAAVVASVGHVSASQRNAR